MSRSDIETTMKNKRGSKAAGVDELKTEMIEETGEWGAWRGVDEET